MTIFCRPRCKLTHVSQKSETKPFTNFSVFHTNLLSRLKALSSIQSHFETRLKEIEARHADKVSDIKKTLEVRWKAIERFESSVKSVAEMKGAWRRKFAGLNGEMDILKVSSTLPIPRLLANIKYRTDLQLRAAITVRLTWEEGSYSFRILRASFSHLKSHQC